jgi:putative oxidoreductase
LDFAPGAAWAWLVTVVQFFGGVCLVLGVLVRPAAALIAIEMLVATVKVNWARGFLWSRGGWETPVLLAVLAAIVAVTGRGWGPREDERRV